MSKIVTKNDMGRAICEMSYDEKENWIYAKWEGFANLEAIKSWGESYIKLLIETGCPNFLNDDSKSTGPWTNALEWIQSYLIPNAIENGVRYYAHVVSESAFAALSSQELNSRIADILEIGSFNNVEDAKKWLQEMQAD
jgi:hypothetical protein